ncbi:hypothetical protein ATEIFO6365_0001017500 [Aspergillus terreus]|uniref:Uncharacterized protein n=1 Tax=Aspergillus terreus TaxID=33178 RepID=A0A5M3YZ64_ASPTE|nr:hypothetical protein ATETN484_0006045800 [Aspergillus terreus]GFF11952.1 hypothetical protein ATEIFO6365_0001017500 [Aspergillus terreus]
MDGRSHPLRNGPSQAATVLSSTTTTTTTAMAPSHPLNLASSHPANPFLSGTSIHHPPTAPSQIQIQTQPHDEHDLRRGSLAKPSSQNPSASTVRPDDSQATDQPPPFETYPHAIAGGGGGPTATAPFLRDFSLVAEAAKRAQMSIVMRDLESVTL